jgi:hypothetical protein
VHAADAGRDPAGLVGEAGPPGSAVHLLEGQHVGVEPAAGVDQCAVVDRPSARRTVVDVVGGDAERG